MALLENIKTTIPVYDDDFINLSESLKGFSNALRSNNKEEVQKYIMHIVHFNIYTAHKYDIDMKVAWYRWRKKAKAKKYVS